MGESHLNICSKCYTDNIFSLKFEDIKETILDKLASLEKEKKISFKEKVCVVDGIINLPLLQKVTGNVVVGATVVPSIVVVGQEIGMLYFFSLKVLLK